MKELDALELVFAAECNGQPGPMPQRVPARLRRRLIESGLIEIAPHRFGGGSFAVTCDTLVLTHAGRIRYCAAQRDSEEPDDAGSRI